MASTVPTHFKLKPPLLQKTTTKLRNPRACFSSAALFRKNIFNSKRFVLTRATDSGSNGAVESSLETKDVMSDSTCFGDGYVGLFVRMLGLDNDPLDREQAVVALWKYSLGGKKCVDAIMQFHGCVNLTVNLLSSESSSTCEAAAGLLRSVSSINIYRDSVAESGAIEEITGLLRRQSWNPEVKEQSLCTLWNLSVDEKLRKKIANADLLQLLVQSLDDEDIKVKEAAGGILANLVLSSSNHSIIVEAGAITKLVKLLQADDKGMKVLKKEAKNILLELVKDNYHKILIIEEGLVPVPLIGSDAYKSFQPDLYSWPSLPDGTDIEQTSKAPSRYGASELLIGLNMDEKKAKLEEAKMNAVLGRTRQQFLVRVGGIELDDQNRSPDQGITLLPWIDAVARLVLILGLEEESTVARAAESIADASINEHMRISFKEAGAIKHLVQLLDHKNDYIKSSVIQALAKLSVSNEVCHTIKAEGVLYPLTNILKHSENSNLIEKTLDILARTLDPSKELKSVFYNAPVNGLKDLLDAARGSNASVSNNGERNGEILTKVINRKEVPSTDVINRLVVILKSSSSNLQRKAATVLEWVTIIDPSMDSVLSVDIESGLHAVFQQNVLNEVVSDEEFLQPELDAVVIEESGLAVSAASRLLTRLLESDQFCRTINASRFTQMLRKILKSNVPLHSKNWVAACLVKLSTLGNSEVDVNHPISMEVTLFESIPRLIEQIKTSPPDLQEAAVVELNRIISEGMVDSTMAIASEGGIYPLVKLIEEGTDRAVDASLAILYNLSMNSENHSAIMSAGTVSTLRRIVLSQRPQWTQALRLLRALPT